MEYILNILGLSVGFRIKRDFALAIRDVSLKVKKGEIVCVVGESGCGKTITALSIMRLLPPNSEIAGGRIMFEGKDLLSLSEDEMRSIRGNEISIIFQEPLTSLNPVFRIGDQIAETIKVHKKMKEDEIKRRCIELLELVGIKEPEKRIYDYPHQLSGGQRQRVMIAISLACNPKLIIADEPTTALDVTVQAQILRLFKELQRKLNISLLYITHDLSVVAQIADRVYVMYAGMIMEEGKVEDIFYRPRHPYTIGLLESLPKRERSKRLKSIPGMVPDIFHRPSGCLFHPRCSLCKDICKSTIPDLRDLGDGHRVRCHVI